MSQDFSEEEITEVLEQMVLEGKLERFEKDGKVFYRKTALGEALSQPKQNIN